MDFITVLIIYTQGGFYVRGKEVSFAEEVELPPDSGGLGRKCTTPKFIQQG
jgi:hypothetical protein